MAEIEPAEYDPERLRRWIKTRTWGHHACGTCRIGKDPWRASTQDLVDKEAVIDSKFRVHGVEALRIVDASIFHEIPGYFIVTPIYMISEKAADTLLEAEARYPARLEGEEATAVRKRRKRAMKAEPPDESAPEKLPAETVGLALSGGGIRSATFCLGILQGFARRDRIRDIDFLFTTSGGGYIGSFLGRLFTRKEVKEAIDPVGRVQDTIKNNASAPLQWLRSTVNYSQGGSEDARTIYAILLRNLFTIYFVLTLAGISAFGLMRLTADWIGCWVPAAIRPPFVETDSKWAHIISPWWWLPLIVLVLGVLPGGLAFFLAFTQAGHDRSAEFLSYRRLGLSPCGAGFNDGIAGWISSRRRRQCRPDRRPDCDGAVASPLVKGRRTFPRCCVGDAEQTDPLAWRIPNPVRRHRWVGAARQHGPGLRLRRLPRNPVRDLGRGYTVSSGGAITRRQYLRRV